VRNSVQKECLVLTPKAIKCKGRIMQIICLGIPDRRTGAATLKARQPVCTGQLVAWHYHFDMHIANVSEITEMDMDWIH